MDLELVVKELEETFAEYEIEEIDLLNDFLDFTIGTVSGYVCIPADIEQPCVEVFMYSSETGYSIGYEEEKLDVDRLKEEIKNHLEGV